MDHSAIIDIDIISPSFVVFYFLISSRPVYLCTADKNLEIDFIITFSISLAFPLIGFNILAQLLGVGVLVLATHFNGSYIQYLRVFFHPVWVSFIIVDRNKALTSLQSLRGATAYDG